MYCDFSQEPRVGVDRVLVIQENDREACTIDEIVQEARNVGAVYEDNDNDDIFYVIFEGTGQLKQSNEQMFRSDLARWFDEKERPNINSVLAEEHHY